MNSGFRYAEGNERCSGDTQTPGFQHRSNSPQDTGILQTPHSFEHFRFGNTQPVRNRLPWAGNKGDIILECIEQLEVDPVVVNGNWYLRVNYTTSSG